ncbi:hypothetical protein GCM10028826_00220 [Mucilaginibacter boryungensis]
MHVSITGYHLYWPHFCSLIKTISDQYTGAGAGFIVGNAQKIIVFIVDLFGLNKTGVKAL